jgi:putative hydrolase of the HAD superfamily
MVLIFDLDDTLYDERTYVESGFRAVAGWGESKFGWDPERSFLTMMSLLDAEGRGAVFNRWLEAKGVRSKSSIRECVNVYRHHKPDISVPEPIQHLLFSLLTSPMYLLTDGHKIVQANKIAALGIAPLFRRCYITHRYGVASAKPSLRCFELIKARERCEWGDMMYIGDNPAKDFVNLNAVGAHTIRVKTGMHKDALAKPGFEAQRVIVDLFQLPSIIAVLRP